MSMASSNAIGCCIILLSICGMACAKLSSSYYDKSCPKLLPTVDAEVRAAIKKEARMAASLLRLHFHDCFVNGCDASVLLDDNSTFTGEKRAAPNLNSIRGFDVIDDIKSKVEKVCPALVSCADVLALAARDSVVALGGPSWIVPLGRRDSVTASITAANSSIPAPTLNLSQLISSFANQGLSRKDLVALSGSHTIGLARCTTFRGRIYNDTDINATFAKSLQAKCPKSGSDNKLARLDLATPNQFDNCYFQNLLRQKGLLHSDQQLFNGGSTDSQVKKYVDSTSTFFKDFAKSMVKMGNIKPLTGNKGEIRINCRKVN